MGWETKTGRHGRDAHRSENARVLGVLQKTFESVCSDSEKKGVDYIHKVTLDKNSDLIPVYEITSYETNTHGFMDKPLMAFLKELGLANKDVEVLSNGTHPIIVSVAKEALEAKIPGLQKRGVSASL